MRECCRSGTLFVDRTVQFHHADRPENPHRFLTVRGGYHGDTFDGMSVCDPEGGMHAMWSGVLPQQVFGPRPLAPGGDIAAWAAEFRALAAERAEEFAGLIVEPLLQGAGGMRAYRAECLPVFREVADEHGLVLIFDEIATGFGRTGTMFAADEVTMSPDVLCVGKALTGEYLSMAATLCSSEVAHAVSASAVSSGHNRVGTATPSSSPPRR